MSIQFWVSVTPAVNQVHVGDTATFECMVHGGGAQIREYEWVGNEKIALEERFTYEDNKKILHINDIKSYDNNTMVDCTATAYGGVQMKNSSKLVALPQFNGGVIEDMSSQNGTVGEFDYPPITAGGGVLVGVLYLLVIFAFGGTIWWLKRKEIQKHHDVEASRKRYSRIINSHSAQSAPPQVQYNRGADNVLLNNGRDWDVQDSGEISDNYEDMIPSHASVPAVPAKTVVSGSPRVAPRNLPLGGSPRSMQPRVIPAPGAAYRYPPR